MTTEAERLAAAFDTGDYTICEIKAAAALLRQQATELKRLHDYDNRLTAVVPADFKDWHENSNKEWPELAAGVITSLREREDEAWKHADRLSEMADKWNDECDEFREDNKRLASELDKANALLRQALDAMRHYMSGTLAMPRFVEPETNAAIDAIKQHLGEV